MTSFASAAAGTTETQSRTRTRMSARILVVEDEEALTTLLRYNLDAEGYEVETVARGDEADTRLKERIPDLVVLDWMLPGLSGIELCRRLRARPETKQLPIIMLTARGEESERVRGLATGADDYIVKPFSVPELLARVKGAAAAREPGAARHVLSFGDIELDRDKHRVARSGRPIDLGPTEYRLLEFFLSIPAGCSAASNCSTASGAATSISTSAPWTFISGGCASCSIPAASRIRSAPCAARATRWTSGLRRRRVSEPLSSLRTQGPIRQDITVLAGDWGQRRCYNAGGGYGLLRSPGTTLMKVAAVLPRLRRLAAAVGGGLIGDARVVRAIGQAVECLAAAEEEFRARGIADRPVAGGFAEFEQRQPLAHRHDIVDRRSDHARARPRRRERARCCRGRSGARSASCAGRDVPCAAAAPPTKGSWRGPTDRAGGPCRSPHCG